MIFYFSGTGNSEYAARRIAERTGNSAVSVAESVKTGSSSFFLADDEALGFIFPVHAFDAPGLVMDFVRNLKLENYNGQYTFVVLTCAANTGVAYDNLNKALTNKGIALRFARNIFMPDNYVVMFNPPKPGKKEKILAGADRALDETAAAIAGEVEAVLLKGKNPPRFVARAVSYLFNKYGLGKKKFRVGDGCLSCGLCEKICPASAIALEKGRPRWRAEKCAKCMGCINRCRAEAIQYGYATRKRARYVNPIYEKS